MRKLEHNIVIKIPIEVQEGLKEAEYDFPDVEECVVEIYHVEDIDEFEIYRINIPVIGDDFKIEINSMLMEASRQIEEEGGGTVEEFIMYIVMQNIRRDAEEGEIRDFFEDISD